MEGVLVAVAGSVAAKLAGYLVDPTLQQLQYLFCVDKISENVEIKKKELILKQRGVEARVQDAIKTNRRIDDEVIEWMNDVQSLIAVVDNLEQQLRANDGCLQGWCPTWRRYCLCKELATTTQRMIDLIRKTVNFNQFSHHVAVPGAEYHSSKDFMFFKSTEMAYSELWGALNDDDSSIIGLWGMGGSGKTTLVKKVGKEAEKLKLFDRVVITTVSQTPNIMKMQGEIADLLELELKGETEAGRARSIAVKLRSSKERILIILDDVWKILNLEHIGNPFGDEGPRNCKVLLTTRRREVCNSMGCQNNVIQLNLLKEDEAWTLFQTHVNVVDADEEVVAQEIVVECKGLPIAIVPMAKCLKGKGIDKMKVTLDRLRNAKPIDVDRSELNAFASLELSYEFLENPKAKLLLLMCAMFPEDHKIDVEGLCRYGVGLGLRGEVNSFESIRSVVGATIKDLIDSSLLIHSPSKFSKGQEYVTMHDVVRDFALWKASEEGRTIIVNCRKELNRQIDNERLKDCYIASSWYDEEDEPRSLLGASKFGFQLDAPKLKLLMLCSRMPLEISNESFKGAKGLQALIIMHQTMIKKKVQPQSLQMLSNLQSLRLQGLELCDISFVVSLTKLEILDLQHSKFERIPNGIENLSKLKLLDLSDCEIEECCYKVIGMCSQLEELYTIRHRHRHSRNTNCYEFLAGPIALRKLRRYALEIGDDTGMFLKFHNEGKRNLCLRQLNMSMLGSIIKDLAQRATAIEFYELKGGSKSFMSNIVPTVEGMNELTNLLLKRCSKIECINDETTHHKDVAMPRLDELELTDMNNLKQLHRGSYPFSLFQKLERLTISHCPQLLHIFPPDCNLGNLRLLKISKCPMLTSLFPASVACTLFSLEELTIKRCSQLMHVVEEEGGGGEWENLSFSKLKILSVDGCDELEFVCPIFLALKFVQLQRLVITNSFKMEVVFDEGQPMHDQDEIQILLPLLEHLQLENLPNLAGICLEKYHRRWPSIKIIKWRDCSNMELHEVKGHQLRNEELYKPLAAIEWIFIDNCVAESIFHNHIGVEEQIQTFQHLKVLTLKNCGGLKFVFYADICRSFPELTSVTVSCCKELEAIFSGNEETQKNLSTAETCLPKLQYLEISECEKLKFILSFKMRAAMPLLPQLSTLTISDSSQMEEVFRCSDIEDYDIDGEREITFPNMRDVVLHDLPRLVNVCAGFKLHIGDFCDVEVHGCPKLMPIKSATISWTKERFVRKYVSKYSQLNGNESLNLSLYVLNVGEPDTQSSRVEHKWKIIGDDDQEEQQMIGGIIPTQFLRFQYLHSLKLTHFKELKYLFSASTIVQNSLPKLTSLTILDCKELEEIIAENGEDQKIVLSSLRKIELNNLPNFESVCQGRLQVELMSDIISISNCPKFVGSNLGSALQQLGTISVSNKDSNVDNSSSSNVNEERGAISMISSAKKLYLEDSMSLISLWEGRTSIMFQNLRRLSVIGCRRLKCMFPNSVIRNLPCLEGLLIKECEEMEEIIMSSSSVEEHHHHSLCFPQLQYLGVIKCGSLKWLFPSLPSIQGLPWLVRLRIIECSQLKGLFNNNQIEIHEEELFDTDNILPKLKSFKIKDCPIFSKTTLSRLPRDDDDSSDDNDSWDANDSCDDDEVSDDDDEVDDDDLSDDDDDVVDDDDLSDDDDGSDT